MKESVVRSTKIDTHCPRNNNGNHASLKLRSPRPADIREIDAVVRTCRPYLDAHISYVYWAEIHCYSDTSAVAELAGEIVGWCSILQASGRGKYFLHQIAVTPSARRRGVAKALLAYLLNRLKHQVASEFEDRAGFALEFTIDRKNAAALNLIRGVAERSGMQLRKRRTAVRLLENTCAEELYLMTSATDSGRHPAACQLHR